MTLLRAVLAPLGGLLLLSAFFLPWGTVSVMTPDARVFTAYDLAQHDTAWNLVAVCAVLMITVGSVGLVVSLTGKTRSLIYAGAGTLLFSMVSGVFIARMLLRVYGKHGVRLGWIEGATAADLQLSLQVGVALALLGVVLGVIGGAWTVHTAKKQLA
ncbi:MAG: hypothetical protein P9L99_05640 [Candidatus Lernaella stagnicola]|nr:hypothetical protein [Candidatus Lernaella stagnicola]